MKQALQYAVKVAFTSLLATIPLSFLAMMSYMALLPLLFDNYNFNVSLSRVDLVVFLVLVVLAILVTAKRTVKIDNTLYNKPAIVLKSISAAMLVFCFYLLLTGKLSDLSLDEFLVSYGPPFLITYVCMKLYPLKAEEADYS